RRSARPAVPSGLCNYELMASASALIIPLSLFFIGTRIWSLGHRHGFMTPLQMLRDRWECGLIVTVMFPVAAILLVPHIIVGVMCGGTTLAALSAGLVPYWRGPSLLALV